MLCPSLPMSKLHITAVDIDGQKVSGYVIATNDLGTRHIGIAFYVPDADALERIAALPLGTVIWVNSRTSDKGSPCAMTLVDFEVLPSES